MALNSFSWNNLKRNKNERKKILVEKYANGEINFYVFRTICLRSEWNDTSEICLSIMCEQKYLWHCDASAHISLHHFVSLSLFCLNRFVSVAQLVDIHICRQTVHDLKCLLWKYYIGFITLHEWIVESQFYWSWWYNMIHFCTFFISFHSFLNTNRFLQGKHMKIYSTIIKCCWLAKN